MIAKRNQQRERIGLRILSLQQQMMRSFLRLQFGIMILDFLTMLISLRI